MEKVKQWVALAVLASLAIVAGGWFLLVSPKRSEAADLRVQAEDQVVSNSALAQEIEVLKAQAADLPKEQAKLATIATQIPDNPALPGLIRQLMEASDKAGVDLVSITPGQPALRTPPAPATPEAPAETAQVDGATEAPADPAAPAPAGPAGSLAEIPLTVNVYGSYYEVQAFLAAAEEMARAFRVQDLQMAPGASPVAGDSVDPIAVEKGRSLAATVNGFVFMAADRPAPAPAAVPGDAAAAEAASTTTTDAAQ